MVRGLSEPLFLSETTRLCPKLRIVSRSDDPGHSLGNKPGPAQEADGCNSGWFGENGAQSIGIYELWWDCYN